MTYCKTGTEFWDECADAGLSADAKVTHAEAITWIYRIERTDMRIPKKLVRRLASSDEWEKAVADLIAVGFWADDGDTYRVIHHADVVRGSIGAQRNYRDRNRKDQAAHRKRKSARDVSADVSADPDSQSVNTSQEVDESKNQTEYVWCRRCREVQTTEADGVCRGCRRVRRGRVAGRDHVQRGDVRWGRSVQQCGVRQRHVVRRGDVCRERRVRRGDIRRGRVVRRGGVRPGR